MTRLAPLLILFLLAGCGRQDGTLSADQAWVRLPPEGVQVTAAYLVIRNQTAESVDLVSASSPRFAAAELHRMTNTDGMQGMREIDAITVAAGEVLQLAPGGLHLMLMQPKSPLQADELIELRLSLRASDGSVSEILVPATVRRP